MRYFQLVILIFNNFRAQRFVLWFDKNYLISYIPFQVNTGNYLIGMIAAFILLHLQKNNIDLTEKKV